MLEPLVETRRFVVVGICIRTSNAPGRAEIDIPAVYAKFYKEDYPKLLESAKTQDALFALYANYDSDEKGEYDFMLGYAVSEEYPTPKGFVRWAIPVQTGRYFQIKPGAPEEVVPKFWAEIWRDPNIHSIRTYTFDWEEYSEAGIRVFLSSR